MFLSGIQAGLNLRGKRMNQKGFIGIIGLLLAVGIISFMAYFAFKDYFTNPTGMNKESQQVAHQAGIETTSQVSVIKSVKSQVQDIQAIQEQQIEQVMSDSKK
jgi:hypothetical protein